MAEVEVTIEPATMTAVITKSSVDNLAIKPGDAVVLIIKSTEVIVGSMVRGLRRAFACPDASS